MPISKELDFATNNAKSFQFPEEQFFVCEGKEKKDSITEKRQESISFFISDQFELSKAIPSLTTVIEKIQSTEIQGQSQKIKLTISEQTQLHVLSGIYDICEKNKALGMASEQIDSLAKNALKSTITDLGLCTMLLFREKFEESILDFMTKLAIAEMKETGN